jgi:catechol 2,3-dioxygenase-like lactoylglutathione lyase family enzyme
LAIVIAALARIDQNAARSLRAAVRAKLARASAAAGSSKDRLPLSSARRMADVEASRLPSQSEAAHAIPAHDGSRRRSRPVPRLLLQQARTRRNPPHRQREGALHPGFLAARDDLERAREARAPLVELTYNWDEHDYQGGRNFGHLAYRVDDIYETCRRLMESGVTINRPPRDGYMAFIRSPYGISIELLQAGEAKAPQEPWSSMPEHRFVVRQPLPIAGASGRHEAVLCVGIATLDQVFAVEAMPTRAEKYRAHELW